ncbi:glycosyltransferase family 1 protein [Nodosilinea sp. LEGE 07088]|nr:glycosyltransferase family 1 protein [Nodosilinea sp. LEGE 07088]
MWKTLNIDFVAPPFGGHLYPLLELASYLRHQGMENLRVVSTPAATPAIATTELEGVYLLKGEDAAISAIANPPYEVRSNPRRLLQQFRANLSLMADLKLQLRGVWQGRKPDLVIADFTLPVAGMLAQEMGVNWWTSSPTLCAIETQTGTPSYLGGLMPGQSWYSRIRDFMGRRLIHSFKTGVGWWFRDELRSLNISSIYRADGHERIYSPTKILGLGLREFEFERDWPTALDFVGPLTASPTFRHSPPVLPAGVRHVLVSLGTHLLWAKAPAALFIEQVAAQMPGVHFHFSYGVAGEQRQRSLANIHTYGYLPYDNYMTHFDAAIIHGGTGVLYSCIKAGVPMLVWPHDYDQFDHAARIIYHGLGLRFKANLNHTVNSLNQLFFDPKISAQVKRFKALASQYNPQSTILELIQQTSGIRSK